MTKLPDTDLDLKVIHKALAALGHDGGDPGTLDAETVKAVQAFQWHNDLSPTGKLDGQTLELLLAPTLAPPVKRLAVAPTGPDPAARTS